MRVSRLMLVASVVLLLVLTLSAKPGQVQCNVDFDDVIQRQYSGITQEEYRVIDNQAEFEAYWDQIHSIMFPQPPYPVIDFAGGEVVISAAIGSRPNGCYGVSISCIQGKKRSDDLKVFVTEAVPGPRCACTQAIVNPVHMVKVDGPVGSVDFIKQLGVMNCQ